jgi:hypothetical protein
MMVVWIKDALEELEHGLVDMTNQYIDWRKSLFRQP